MIRGVVPGLRTVGVWSCLLGYSLLACAALPFDGRRRFYKRLMRACSSMMLRIAGVELEVRGLEHVDLAVPGVYVSNHASMLDMVCIIAGVSEELGFMYKKDMHAIPAFGWALRFGGLNFPIHRGRNSIVTAEVRNIVEGMRNGRSVFVFAEGSRTTDGKIQPFKDGAFYLARKADAPLVPITIKGTYAILPKDSRCIRPGKVVIVIDEPLLPARFDAAGGISGLKQAAYREIQDHYSAE